MTLEEKLGLLSSMINDSISSFASMAEEQNKPIQSEIPDETLDSIKNDVSAIMEEAEVEKAIGQDVSSIIEDESQGLEGWDDDDQDDDFDDDEDFGYSEQASYSECDYTMENDEEDEVVSPSPSSPEPVPVEVQNVFYPDDFKKALFDSFQCLTKYYNGSKATKKLNEERKKPTTPKQCSENVYYKKNTIEMNGMPFEYKVLQKEVNWGTAFTKSFKLDDKLTNLEKLNEKIIEDIKLTFGDLDRITDIAVVSGMLLINGTQYYPLCKDKDFLDGLPFDCVDYLKSGCIAEFFDFGYLTHMPYLSYICFDSMEFVVKRVRHDLGMHGEFSPKAMFKMFKNLQGLEIAGIRFISPGVALDENGNKSEEAEKEFTENYYRQTRFGEIYDKVSMEWVPSIRKWGVNNVVNWANNRGNKGFLGYAWGIVWRSGLTLGVGVGEASLRGIGFITKTVRTMKAALDITK